MNHVIIQYEKEVSLLKTTIPFISYSFDVLVLFIASKIRLMMTMKTIDPIKAGIIANPPVTGPHLLNKELPIQEPIIPAIALLTTLSGIFFSGIRLASHPRIPPTISDHIKNIINFSFSTV